MFTGIIEESGTVDSLESRQAGARLVVNAARVISDLPIGGSVAVNGVCLTAVDVTPASFSADLSPETLERSNLGSLEKGSRVNLERPLKLTGRLDGHFVLGHVDGVGDFLSCEPVGDGNWWLRMRAPHDLLRYLVHKGSIAIDGISLTIASLDSDIIGVAVIPHTYRQTSLGVLTPGAKVNIEADMIAKHVERLLQPPEPPLKSGLQVEDLQGQGF